ncbi:hypothetical protein C8J56DRAFT_1162395 [Mycena floridula]|nr:hypothetical protein C8J56DRAFT_1162395 [Mycena floridula]
MPSTSLIFLILASASQARTVVIQSDSSDSRMCFGKDRITCNMIWAAMAVAAVILLVSLCFLFNCLCGARRVSKAETLAMPEAPRKVKSIESLRTLV